MRQTFHMEANVSREEEPIQFIRIIHYVPGALALIYLVVLGNLRITTPTQLLSSGGADPNFQLSPRSGPSLVCSMQPNHLLNPLILNRSHLSKLNVCWSVTESQNWAMLDEV